MTKSRFHTTLPAPSRSPLTRLIDVLLAALFITLFLTAFLACQG